MRTHGHRERSTTHWGLLGGIGEGQQGVGSWGEIAWGEMTDIGEGGMEAANHIAMYVHNPAIILHDLHMYPRT